MTVQQEASPISDFFLIRAKELSLHGGPQTQGRHATGLEISSLTTLHKKWVAVLRHCVEETRVTAKDQIEGKTRSEIEGIASWNCQEAERVLVFSCRF